MAAVKKPAAVDEPVAREPVREQVRQAAGSVMGHNNPPRGRAVAVGRDGQPIWRHGAANAGHDKYDVTDIQPPGWVYQWKAHTVLNQPDPQYAGRLRSAGWTPVMAETHPGRFHELGYVGPIIVDGLMLMETPFQLWQEGDLEGKRMAAEKVDRSRQQHGLAPATTGIDVQNRGVRQNTFVRSQVEDGSEIPRPKYERQPID